MKKIFNSACILLTILTAGQNVYAYTDVPITHWAYEPITAITLHSAFNGYNDDTFRPEGLITYEEFVKTAMILSDQTIQNTYAYTGRCSPWAQPYLDTAVDLNIVDRTAPDTAYTPITRKDMACVIARTLELGNAPQNYDLNTCASAFIDWNNVSDSYKIYIAKAYASGIMNGYDDNTFRPDAVATRAEAAAVLSKLVSCAQTPEQAPDTGFQLSVTIDQSALDRALTLISQSSDKTELPDDVKSAAKLVETTMFTYTTTKRNYDTFATNLTERVNEYLTAAEEYLPWKYTSTAKTAQARLDEALSLIERNKSVPDKPANIDQAERLVQTTFFTYTTNKRKYETFISNLNNRVDEYLSAVERNTF